MPYKTKRFHMAKGYMISKGTCSGGDVVICRKDVWNVAGWWVLLSGHEK